jgi:3-hydroxyisobutyrate dehydrogenase-like beta-hydroxyacid dehydrogenase
VTDDLTVGLVGLGNMGAALADNLVGAGLTLVAHDLAGPDRCPAGADFVTDVGDLARRAAIVVLSLPDGSASTAVCQALTGASESQVTHVVDTSTIGPETARHLAAALATSGVAYVDSPVSGGVSGARARTLAVMYAGDADACAHIEPVLAGLSDRRFRIGDRPGMAQAVKLANNFLSATALAATSEAIAFTTSEGVDMATALDVLNASSGRNGATSDKFVNHVLTGAYRSGFTNSLMTKDLGLYLQAAESSGSPARVGRLCTEVWQQFTAEEPDADFTRIHPFTSER